jgi:hypothetical protein
VVLFREPTRLRYSVRSPRGRFRPPVTLAEGAVLHRFGSDEQLAVSPRGEVFASWRQLDPATGVSGLRVAIRAPGGAFSPSQTLSDPGLGVDTWDLAFAPGGGSVFAWSEISPEGTRLAISRRSAGADFDAPRRLEDASASPRRVSALKADVADDGAALVAWSENVESCHACRIGISVAPPGAALGPPVSPYVPNTSSLMERHGPVAAQADPGGGGAVAFSVSPDCLYCFETRLHTATLDPAGALTASRALNSGTSESQTTEVAHPAGASTVLWAEPSADRDDPRPGRLLFATRSPRGPLPVATQIAPGRAFGVEAVPWGTGPVALALWQAFDRRYETSLRARLVGPGRSGRVELLAPRPRGGAFGELALAASGGHAVAAWTRLDPDDNDRVGIDAAVR